MRQDLIVMLIGCIIAYLSPMFLPDPPQKMVTSFGVVLFLVGAFLLISALLGVTF